MPDVVESDTLEQSNGILVGTEAATEHLAGPVVGTWLFAMDKAIPFFTDAIALVLSCFPLISFRSKAPKSDAASPSAWEGVRVLWADRRLRLLILMVASLAGLQGMESGVLVLLATTEWGIREGAYGVFLAVGAAGNLVGSLLANRLVRRFGSAQALSAPPSSRVSATWSWPWPRGGSWRAQPSWWSVSPSALAPSSPTRSARG